jgi:hypothetical protein
LRYEAIFAENADYFEGACALDSPVTTAAGLRYSGHRAVHRTDAGYLIFDTEVETARSGPSFTCAPTARISSEAPWLTASRRVGAV